MAQAIPEASIKFAAKEDKEMKRGRINPYSVKGKIRRDREKALVVYLAEYRAKGRCEICFGLPDFRGLSGAHIELRDYTGANDTAGNIVIACGRCHDHSRHFKGLCISQEAALELVRKQNEKYGIDPKMTGADVLLRQGVIDD